MGLADEGTARQRMEFLGAAVLLVWGLFQFVFFAYRIAGGIFPDEPEHFIVVLSWMKHPGFFLSNVEETLQFGQVSARPPLFYALFGLLSGLSPENGSMNQLVLLRIFNAALTGLNVFYVYRLARETLATPTARILALGVVTNVLMFCFMGGALNYDGLNNLLCTAGIFYLFRGLRHERPVDLAKWALCLGLAGLTKITALPVFLLSALIAGGWLARRPISGRRFVAELRARPGILAATLVVLTAFAAFHGGNLVRYQRLFPGCAEVLGHDFCREHSYVYRSSLRGKASNENARRMAFLPFAGEYHKVFRATLLGALGHRAIDRPQVFRFLKILAALSVLGAWGLRSAFREPAWHVAWSLAALTLGFYGVLVVQNYSTYLASGSFGLALQARYFFPMMSAFAVFAAGLWANAIANVARWLRFPRLNEIGLSLVLAGGAYESFGYFLRHVDPSWFFQR